MRELSTSTMLCCILYIFVQDAQPSPLLPAPIYHFFSIPGAFLSPVRIGSCIRAAIHI